MTKTFDIWKNLEKLFSLTNGSCKYKICKDLYEVKQYSATINDYYTTMRTFWEELESMTLLPAITSPTEKVTKLLETIELQKEEGRLFQFLDGVNDNYAPLRSQLLMRQPLPTLEEASAVL